MQQAPGVSADAGKSEPDAGVIGDAAEDDAIDDIVDAADVDAELAPDVVVVAPDVEAPPTKLELWRAKLKTPFVWDPDGNGKVPEGHPLPWAVTASMTMPPVTVTIPKGEFWMGCNPKLDKHCDPDGIPQVHVFLDAYEIAVFQTSVAQWDACMKAGLCNMPDLDSSSVCTGSYGGEVCFNETLGGIQTSWTKQAVLPWRWLHPMNSISWSQAQQFCQSLGEGWDLPTEAQWARAARGGCELYPGQDCKSAMPTYAWGEWGTAEFAQQDDKCPDEPECKGCLYTKNCWVKNDEKAITYPSGSLPLAVSPYGVHGFGDRIAEFTRDFFRAPRNWVESTKDIHKSFNSSRTNTELWGRDPSLGLWPPKGSVLMNPYVNSAPFTNCHALRGGLFAEGPNPSPKPHTAKEVRTLSTRFGTQVNSSAYTGCVFSNLYVGTPDHSKGLVFFGFRCARQLP